MDKNTERPNIDTQLGLVEALSREMTEFREKWAKNVLKAHTMPFSQFMESEQQIINTTRDKVFDIVHASTLFKE